jgi:hypothetical protein
MIPKTFGHDPERFFQKISGAVGPEAGISAVGQAVQGQVPQPGMGMGMGGGAPGMGPQAASPMMNPGILNAVRGMQ